MAIALITNASFKSFLVRQVYLWFIAAIALVCGLWEWTFSDLVSKPLEIFNQARPASSTDREFVISQTLTAWKESPWFGWGIVQGTANWYTYEIELGSFSTYAGVLYLHGIFGLIFLIIALATTLVSFWNFALEGNQLCQKAIALDYEQTMQAFEQTKKLEAENDTFFQNHQVIKVFYEDLVENNRSEIAKIQNFLNVKPTPVSISTKKRSLHIIATQSRFIAH